MDVYLPLAFAVILGLTYYFSNKYSIRHKEWNKKIISFSAGVSITYILLELFPVFTEGALILNKLLFVSILVGFIAHHIIEKEIYKHNHRHELVKMLSLEENIFSFVYHIIIGAVMVTFFKSSVIQGVLFFIPMVFYTFLSTLPTSPHPKKIKGALLSGATFIGAVIGVVLWTVIPSWFQFMLMGLAIGALLFTVIRHHIPFGRRGRIGWFTIGFSAYSLLIILSWYI